MMRFFKKASKAYNQFDSREYWEARYLNGGNSGEGSYGRLSLFKAEVINAFIKKNNLDSVIEFGCGDGNQLSLADYNKYIGLDVSKTAIKNCIQKFSNDTSKNFFLYDQDCFADNTGIFLSDVALSLDVLYHLVEQNVYEKYLINLFSSSKLFVIIYAANENTLSATAHEKYRKFTSDIDRLIKGWALFDVIKNKFKPSVNDNAYVSQADFFFYRKSN